jgi:hypothetical protein
MEDDVKRIYKMQEGEVEKEEFLFCRDIDKIVFGDKGYVETLGPTWQLVHDPRFLKLEACFIHDRMAMFGGDARLGRQYVDGENFLSTTIADLEQYAEIIGEGRHLRKTVVDAGLNPQNFYKQSDSMIWAIIKQECPNYFTLESKPNKMANTLYQMIKCDLIGLIDDYAQEPLVDQFVEVDSLNVVNNPNDPGLDRDKNPIVYLEVDLIEKALTMRAMLRATAYRVFVSLGFQKYLTENESLTDLECDNLLRMLYQSNWPDEKPKIISDLMQYIHLCNSKPYDERLQEQLALAKVNSQEVATKLRSGEMQRINQYTEPVTDVEDHATRELKAIINDPLKHELFQAWVAAEKRGDMAAFEAVRPIMEDPDYVITESEFKEKMLLLYNGNLPEAMTVSSDKPLPSVDDASWDMPPDPSIN